MKDKIKLFIAATLTMGCFCVLTVIGIITIICITIQEKFWEFRKWLSS